MSFDNPLFLPFALLAFTLFRLLPAWRGAVLLAVSVGFYMVAGWRDLLTVGLLVTANYGLSSRVPGNRGWLVAAILLNLSVLIFFKYRTFLFGGFVPQDVFGSGILIPLGLSFYVFQLIAYQVDVSRGRTVRITSFWLLALFILFFPHQIAGPIMRGNELPPQLVPTFRGRMAHVPRYSVSLGLCVLGLFKKLVLADSLAPFIDVGFAHGPADVVSAWLLALLFTFQIYCDFSGYSDIAVGLARLFGVRLPFNFRQPYLSHTPQEFWRRWHVTLSTWIRDYLYIPLGGSFGGWPRQTLVLLTAMGLAGLWHGANITFVVWGLGWGLLIALWRPVRADFARLGRWQVLLTFACTVVLWVPFRSADLSAMLDFIGTMAGRRPAGDWQLAGNDALLVGLGIAGLAGLHWAEALLFRPSVARLFLRHDGWLLRGFLLGLCFWLPMLPRGSVNPFIYFRF